MDVRRVLLVVLLAGTTMAAKLPSTIKRCARSDPDFKECLRAAIEDALPKLKPGLPKMGFHPLDPMIISEMRLTQGGDGPVNLDLIFTNMSTTKILDDVKVISANFDSDTTTFNAVTQAPHAVALSHYTAKGKVLTLPINGEGPSRVDMYNLTTTVVIKCQKIQKNGKEYLDITKVDAKLTMKKMGLHLDNLFNGDKKAGDAMNKLLNDNWQLIFKELSPSLNEAFSELFRRPGQALFRHVPLEDIMPSKF